MPLLSAATAAAAAAAAAAATRAVPFPSPQPRILLRKPRAVSKISSSQEEVLDDPEAVPTENLQELDEQLKSLSSRQRDPESTELVPVQPPSLALDLFVAERDRGEWPEFSSGFYYYAGGFLLLITLVNNLIYQAVFHEPLPPQKPQETVLPRRRIKSLYQLKHPELFPD